MVPSLLSVAWLSAKAAIFLGASSAVIAGLQKHHDFKLMKKKSNAAGLKNQRRGGFDHVYTSEDASKRIQELRELQEAK